MLNITDNYYDYLNYYTFGLENLQTRDRYNATTNDWQMKTEYWTDGTTKHYEWFADPNPEQSGDVVYQEYDNTGTLIKKQYDDGTIWTPQTLNALQNKEVGTVVGINNNQGQTYNADGVPIVPQIAGQSVNNNMLNR